MIVVFLPSPNCEPRAQGGPVDMLVFHYTAMDSAEAALERLTDPQSKVSSHYLIDERGLVYLLVPESERAWHAGVSSWRGHADVNSRSIGIELAHPGHGPFEPRQIKALIRLSHEILSRHPIPPRNVVGHSDVAPARKQDPGITFPWKRMSRYGIGVWPFEGDEEAPSSWHCEPLAPLLARYGYDVRDEAAALTAFQRHFYPEKLGTPDDSLLRGRLYRLLQAGVPFA